MATIINDIHDIVAKFKALKAGCNNVNHENISIAANPIVSEHNKLENKLANEPTIINGI